MQAIVLIETLWNVNKFQNVESVYMGRRINRNIVECKCCWTLIIIENRQWY